MRRHGAAFSSEPTPTARPSDVKTNYGFWVILGRKGLGAAISPTGVVFFLFDDSDVDDDDDVDDHDDNSPNCGNRGSSYENRRVC